MRRNIVAKEINAYDMRGGFKNRRNEFVRLSADDDFFCIRRRQLYLIFKSRTGGQTDQEREPV